jgi:hypothetical protein
VIRTSSRIQIWVDVSESNTFKTKKITSLGGNQFENCSLRGLEVENYIKDFGGQFVDSRPEKMAKNGFALCLIWQSSRSKWKMELEMKAEMNGLGKVNKRVKQSWNR